MNGLDALYRLFKLVSYDSEDVKEIDFLFETIEDDLEVLVMIKNSLITEHTKLDIRNPTKNDPDFLEIITDNIVKIHQHNLENKLRENLTEWIINNIDKNKVKEWLKKYERRKD